MRSPRSPASRASRRFPIFYAGQRRRDRRCCARATRAASSSPACGSTSASRDGRRPVAILDTGVNDEADGPYPGHESLRGQVPRRRQLLRGPARAQHADRSEREPAPHARSRGHLPRHARRGHRDRLGRTRRMLNGAAPGFYAGLAPDARLVDCKVLSDAGARLRLGGRARLVHLTRYDTWGLTGADSIYRGIDVANMSIGGTDNSDGTDANCAAVNAAHKRGHRRVRRLRQRRQHELHAVPRRRRPGGHRGLVHRRQHRSSAGTTRRRLQQRGSAPRGRRRATSSTR